jgi:propionyl-CoA synthetase
MKKVMWLSNYHCPWNNADLWNDNERFKAGYLNKFPGYYFSGDAGFKRR